MTALYLIAHVAGRSLAIDADRVESVVDIAAIQPVPLAPKEIVGLAALRSRVVTVVDTRVALGLPSSEGPARRAIVSVAGGHPYALLVDSLDDVASYRPVTLDGTVPLSGRWAQIARATVERHGEPILVVDPEALLLSVAGQA